MTRLSVCLPEHSSIILCRTFYACLSVFGVYVCVCVLPPPFLPVALMKAAYNIMRDVVR